MSESPKRSADYQRVVFAVMLLVLAIVFAVLAKTCISTLQYTFYDSNIAIWQSNVLSEQELSEQAREAGNETISLSHSQIAGEWQEGVREAQNYLTIHRLGAAALGVAGLFSLSVAGLFFYRAFHRKKNTET